MQNHQIDQLKEEISGKDLALVKEHFDHMKVGPTVLLYPISVHLSVISPLNLSPLNLN